MGLLNVLFPIFFILIFTIVIGGTLYTLIKSLANKTKPSLLLLVKVVAKRTSRRQGENNLGNNYYVTFEQRDGSRIEYYMSGEEYGLIAEGDFGELKVQGDRFVEFSRIIEED